MILFLSVTTVADSTEEPLGWAQSGGGFDEDYISGHVVLDDDSIVVTGKFTTAIFTMTMVMLHEEE